MFNKIFGEGRLVADPELKKVGETEVVSFTLAMNEYRRVNGETKKEAHFFDFKAWDSGARIIAEKAKKGDRLFFEGRARQEKWEDKTSGQKRSKVVFRVDEFSIVPKTNVDTSDVENETVAV